MGFGAGGMAAAPGIDFFLRTFRQAPTRLGSISDVSVTNVEGRLYAPSSVPGGPLQEVVVASSNVLAKLGDPSLLEGVYLVQSGNTGLATTFLALGCIYSLAIGTSALVFRLPPEGYAPVAAVSPVPAPQLSSPLPATASTMTTPTTVGTPTPSQSVTPVVSLSLAHLAKGNVTPDASWRTPQFWLIWAGMCFNCTAAYALIGAGRTMAVDIFSGAYPLIVTPVFAATFVSMISVFNLGGMSVHSLSSFLCYFYTSIRCVHIATLNYFVYSLFITLHIMVIYNLI